MDVVRLSQKPRFENYLYWLNNRFENVAKERIVLERRLRFSTENSYCLKDFQTIHNRRVVY